jgi:hypothetical protein
MSVTVVFDPSLPYDGIGYNRGCPPGYFAQFVAAGEADATQPPRVVVMGGPTAIRCRIIEGYTPQVNAVETGQAEAESWNNFVEEVGNVAASVGENVGWGLGTIAPWLLAGLALILFLRR